MPKNLTTELAVHSTKNCPSNYTKLVHIGELIKQTLKEKRKSVVWFAGELSCSRTNVYKIFSKQSIDTSDLVRISRILNHNFFEVYSKELEDL